MKYLKLYEDFNIQNNSEIDKICKKFYINNYTLNEDDSIDVDGNVNLSLFSLKKLPLKFNKVSGFFDCSQNNLTTLDGCPREVGSYFYCFNNKLESLGGCPDIVGGDIKCFNNKLETLKGVSNTFENLWCFKNNIMSLDGLSDNIDFGNVYFKLDRDAEYTYNPIYNILQLFNKRPDNFLELFNFYEPIKLIDGEWTIIFEVLNQVLYETGNNELEKDMIETGIRNGVDYFSKYKIIF